MRNTLKNTIVELSDKLPSIQKQILTLKLDQLKEQQLKQLADSMVKMEWLKNALIGIYQNLEMPLGYDQVDNGIEDLKRAELDDFLQTLSTVREQLENDGAM